MEVRLLPPVLQSNADEFVNKAFFSSRKGKPIGDGTRFEIGRARSLGGSTPSPSASLRGRRGGIGPAARLLASNQATGVRIPDPALILNGEGSHRKSNSEHSVLGRAARHGLPKPDRRVRLPRGALPSSLGNRLTGRLPDFESGGGGSNPSSRMNRTGAVTAATYATL